MSAGKLQDDFLPFLCFKRFATSTCHVVPEFTTSHKHREHDEISMPVGPDYPPYLHSLEYSRP